MSEYAGWTLYKDVTLVIKHNSYKNTDIGQAYVVDATNKKQLQTAINWGRITKYKKDADGKYIKDENGNAMHDIIEPDIVTFENGKFKVELVDCAKSSSQGGKVSFWNCKITADNIECIVGIDANLLLSLLLQDTFVNGKCDTDLYFARCSGGVGLLSEKMCEYKYAIKDMQAKKDVNKGKTKKWQVGKTYITLKEKSLYLGDVYKPVLIDIEQPYDFYGTRKVSINIIDNDTPLNHVITSLDEQIGEFKRISEYFELLNNTVNSNISIYEKIKATNNITKASGCLNDIMDIGAYRYSYNQIKNFPSRKMGDFQLEVDINIAEELDKLITKIKEYILNELKSSNNYIRVYSLDSILLSSKSAELSELDIELINTALDKKRVINIWGERTLISCKACSEKTDKFIQY